MAHGEKEKKKRKFDKFQKHNRVKKTGSGKRKNYGSEEDSVGYDDVDSAALTPREKKPRVVSPPPSAPDVKTVLDVDWLVPPGGKFSLGSGQYKVLGRHRQDKTLRLNKPLTGKKKSQFPLYLTTEDYPKYKTQITGPNNVTWQTAARQQGLDLSE